MLSHNPYSPCVQRVIDAFLLLDVVILGILRVPEEMIFIDYYLH